MGLAGVGWRACVRACVRGRAGLVLAAAAPVGARGWWPVGGAGSGAGGSPAASCPRSCWKLFFENQCLKRQYCQQIGGKTFNSTTVFMALAGAVASLPVTDCKPSKEAILKGTLSSAQAGHVRAQRSHICLLQIFYSFSTTISTKR